MLNTESHDQIKGIIFNIYNNKTTDDGLTRIKNNFQNCLLKKIKKQNPEADINTIISIFNDPGKKSMKAKVIENIMTIYIENKLQLELVLENNKRNKKGESEMTSREEGDFKLRRRNEIELELSPFKAKLWQIDSFTYLKQIYGELGLPRMSDEARKGYLENLDYVLKNSSNSNNSDNSNPNRRRGRRRPTQQPDETFGNRHNLNPNAPSFVPSQTLNNIRNSIDNQSSYNENVGPA